MSNDNVSLWGGRFTGAPAQALDALSVSTHFDWRLARVDIAGSKAHARELGRVGLLTEAELDAMLAALSSLDEDVASGKFAPQPGDEDVHRTRSDTWELRALSAHSGRRHHATGARSSPRAAVGRGRWAGSVGLRTPGW